MIVTVTQDVKCSGLRTADDISEFLQKCRFCLRKPPFYPLNYGDYDIFDPFDSFARSEQVFRFSISVWVLRLWPCTRSTLQNNLRFSSATKLPTVTASPYLSGVFGPVEATSFWKRGSFRSGSNIGSSRSSAGVSGMPAASAPAYGIESSFCKAMIARSGSPMRAATRARI